jgi:hypothetical protein
VTLQVVGDPALNAKVDAAYQGKYGISPASTSYFFKAHATEATLRLDAAH